jgi:hypothetical protein
VTHLRAARSLRWLHLGLVGAGAVLLVALVRAIGVEQLAAELRRCGTAFFGVVALELLLDACNTLGWRRLLRTRVGWWRLYWIRQAGTAVNQLTPTATLGGEIVKGMLLRPYVSAGEAATSVVAAKLSFAIAQTMLVLCGLAAVLSRLHGEPTLRAALVVATVATCVGVGGFFLLQRRGGLSHPLALLARLGIAAESAARLHLRAAEIDQRLAALHREGPGAFAASVAWHFVAQLVGTVQLFYVLHVLGVPVGLGTCLAIEAFALVIDSTLFFVPARIGVQEGSRVLVFTALGLSAATGLAVALIVRLNQLSVATLGLLAYAYFSSATAPAGSAAEGSPASAGPRDPSEPAPQPPELAAGGGSTRRQ